MAVVLTNRRSFLIGLAAGITMPAIITTPGLLMPVKKVVMSPRVWYVNRPHMLDILIEKLLRMGDGASWDTAFGTITEILPRLSVGDIVYCRDTAWNGNSKIIRDRTLSYIGVDPDGNPMKGTFLDVTGRG